MSSAGRGLIAAAVIGHLVAGIASGAERTGERAPVVEDGSSGEPREPLREEAVRGPAGGVKLHLRGRHDNVIGREAGAPGLQPHTCTQPDAARHE